MERELIDASFVEAKQKKPDDRFSLLTCSVNEFEEWKKRQEKKLTPKELKKKGGRNDN